LRIWEGLLVLSAARWSRICAILFLGTAEPIWSMSGKLVTLAMGGFGVVCWTTLLVCLEGHLFGLALRGRCVQRARKETMMLDILIPLSKTIFNVSMLPVPWTDSITARYCRYYSLHL